MYCLKFEQLSKKLLAAVEVIVELRLLLIFAVLTVPGYIVASSLKRCEDAQDSCAESSSSA